MNTILRWRICVPKNRILNPCHLNITPAREGVVHSHDFAELFWVEQGVGIHLINGNEREMQMGDLCMIRPWKDSHKLRALAPDFMIYNVAFPLKVLRDLQKHYFNDSYFWGGTGHEPEIYHLTEIERQWMNAAGRELLRAPQKRLILDRFLLNLLCSTGQAHPDHLRACPPWLRLACQLIHEPEHFSRGTHAFATLARRSPEHVARSLRKYTGKTPSEVVNQARIEYAAGQLASTTREIQDIAMDCGYESLSHFYKLFHKTLGTSPRRYRQEHFISPARILFPSNAPSDSGA